VGIYLSLSVLINKALSKGYLDSGWCAFQAFGRQPLDTRRIAMLKTLGGAAVAALLTASFAFAGTNVDVHVGVPAPPTPQVRVQVGAPPPPSGVIVVEKERKGDRGKHLGHYKEKGKKKKKH